VRIWALGVAVASLAGPAVAASSASSAGAGAWTAHLLDIDAPLPAAPAVDAQERTQSPPPPLNVSESNSPPPMDPHAGSLVAGEVALGAVFVLGADVVSALAGLGVGAALFSGHPQLTLFGVIIVGLILDLALAPLSAAWGAHLASAKRGDNGLGGALKGAYLMQLVSALAGAAALGVGGPLFVVFFSAHYLVLPIGASLGIHWGTAARHREPPPQRISTVHLPTRPHELHAAATPSIASPFFTWAF
jgi:hypothetical protein